MRVAIIGCGQLARMLGQAAARLRADCVFVAIADEGTACVDGLGPVVRWCEGEDVAELYRALGEPDVVTVEREAIDTGLLCALQAFCPVLPDATSVRIGQNRRLERSLLDSLSIPCAPHRVAASEAGVAAAVEALGLPLVVKATEDGYDGKLQWRLHSPADVRRFCRNGPVVECLLECLVEFEREVSIVAARGRDGEFRAYPLTENIHRDGVLVTSIAPARNLTADLQEQAETCARAIMEHLGYVGVMAVEFFVVDGRLWVNELAPRVHNSGHWTMDATTTDQFENHIRAVLGLPLGVVSQARPAGMLNMLGSITRVGPAVAPGCDLRWHDYKKVPAAGRKMGHINVVADSERTLLAAMNSLHRSMYGDINAGLAADSPGSDSRDARGACCV